MIAGRSRSNRGRFEVDQLFAWNALVLSDEAYYGHEFNPEDCSRSSDIEFVGVGLGWLPFDPVGSWLPRGFPEAGLQPIYQQCVEPKVEYFAGWPRSCATSTCSSAASCRASRWPGSLERAAVLDPLHRTRGHKSRGAALLGIMQFKHYPA